MNDSAVIFLGPTLPKNEARGILDAVYLPPAALGDLLSAHQKFHPRVIGLIDGYFECMPSVWHKEILFLMSEGVHVFGSSSMGALRAAELSPFGMVGIGEIFNSYATGAVEDDDEVAVVHGPESLGCPLLSEAMVNIRKTLSNANKDGIITDHHLTALLKIAKGLHYKNRTYANILGSAPEGDIPGPVKKQLEGWLVKGRMDIKRDDARALLNFIREFQATNPAPKEVQFKFQNTNMWIGLLHSLSS